MSQSPTTTVAPVLVAELLVEGERWPVNVHVIDHPDACVLVDTGMTELHPEVTDLDPRLLPLSKQTFDLAGIDIVEVAEVRERVDERTLEVLLRDAAARPTRRPAVPPLHRPGISCRLPL